MPILSYGKRASLLWGNEAIAIQFRDGFLFEMVRLMAPAVGAANAVGLGLWSAAPLAIWLWLAVARGLLTVALAGRNRFDSLLLTWFQTERAPLNFLNDLLLQSLALNRRSEFSRVSPFHHPECGPRRGGSIC